jgi:hypothetical protein
MENTVAKRYVGLKAMVVTRKVQFDALIAFMEGETTWLTSPASTKYHLCTKGGLLEHSVNVAESMLKIRGVLAPKISEESCVIVSLIHDLGKVGMPGNPQYLVNETTENQHKSGHKSDPPYKFNTDLTYLSVPVRSLYLASKHIELTEQEVQAIIYHDGQYVDDNRSVATHEEPLTLLLQYADSWSGFVLESSN